MKLINEYVETDIECIVEPKKTGPRRTLSLKVCSRVDKKESQRSIYPKSIMEKNGKYVR